MFPYSRLNLIFDHIQKNTHIPIKKLCQLVNVTDRTLRSDIQIINDILDKHEMKISLKRNVGYYINYDNQQKYDAFMQEFSHSYDNTIDLDTSHDRIKYLLHILLYSDDYIDLEELANRIYVSKNTLQNYIKSVKAILPKYNLDYISKASCGVKIIGNELDIRKCIIENIISIDFHTYITGFSKEEYALFGDIDLDYIRELVLELFSIYQIKTTDYNIKNFIIHVALMISRVQKDSYINTNNTITIDEDCIKLLKELIAKIEAHFGITISNGEKQYLYLHLAVNSQLIESELSDESIKTIVSEILENIYVCYNFDLRGDVILLHDLFQHFKSILNTKYLSVHKKNPLLNTIKTNFPLAYDITLTSTAKTLYTPPFILTEDEIGYVSLHIGAAIERCFSGNLQRKNVILVCGSSQATTRMLEARLNTVFNDKLKAIRRTSYNEFKNYTKRELLNIDFVISTIPLKTSPIPAITVDFALNNQDIEAITKFIASISLNKVQKFNKFFDKNLFLHTFKTTSKEEILHDLYKLMEQEGIVDEEYYSSVLERESLAKTSMNDVFALPHPMKLCANETKVAVAILDEPIQWNGDNSVQIIFLLAIKQDNHLDIEHLYDVFIEIVNNTRLQQNIIHSYTFDQFINCIIESQE